MAIVSTTPVDLKRDATVISLVGLAHGISHFFHMILAPLFPWIKEEFQLSYSELGLLMTAFFVVSGIGQALAGFIVDKVGARNVLFFGVSCLGLSALLLSGAQNYAMLMSGAMLAGAGNSVFHPSDYTLLNKRVSPARLGHAFSVHGISGNLGWAAAPVFLVSIAGLSSWRTALFCAALLPTIVLCALFWHRHLLQTEIAHESQSAMHAATPVSREKEGLLDFMKLPAVWMCFGFFFVTAMALGAIQSFSSPGLQAMYGMSLTSATTAYTLYMLASALGMLWGGFLAAKATNPDKTIAMAFSFAGLFSFLLATGLAHSTVAVMLMALIGFGAGIAGPSRDLMIRAAAPKNATGRVYGIVYSGLDSGSALAPLIFGAIMDGNHPSWLFIGVGLFQMLAILTAINVGGKTRALAAG